MGLFDFFMKPCEDEKQVKKRKTVDATSGYTFRNNNIDVGFDENGIKTNAQVQIYKPRSFSDVEKIIDNLRENKPAIVYMNELKETTAQRVLDLLSGAIYALKGGIYEIEKGIFIFTPDGVSVNK